MYAIIVHDIWKTCKALTAYRRTVACIALENDLALEMRYPVKTGIDGNRKYPSRINVGGY
jgi:hypothetical protein